MSSYRRRIYDAYVRAGCVGVPLKVEEAFAQQRPYLDQVVRRHFPADRTTPVLDLGCGAGTLLAAAQAAGYARLMGVDVSPEQVARARELGIEVRPGDLLETLRDLPEASQGVVTAFDVLEHFTKDEIVPFVDGVYRVLRPGGRWILHLPNGASPFGGAIRYGDFTHELAFTPKSLRQLLVSSGFSDIQCFEDRPVVHGVKSAARRVVWTGIRTLLRLYLAAETGDLGRNAVLSQNLLAVARR